MTLRAWFAVSLYPCQVFGIGFLFFVPLFNLLTRSWHVFFFETLEAKVVTALALDDIFLCKIIFLDNVVTIFGGAPLDLSIVVRELFTMPRQILFSEIELCGFTFFIGDIFLSFRKRLQEKAMWYHYIAFMLNALGKDASRPVLFDFLLKIFPPTHGGKLVSAVELHRLEILVESFKFIAPDDVTILVVFFEST